jgi:LuxR family maltose regulon positive regulatory protein
MAPAAIAPALRHRSASNTNGARAPDVLDPHGRTEAPGEEFVSRGALVRRLTDASDVKLAVIVAPPGYGKSSLLREWAQCDKRRFHWLSPADIELQNLGATATTDPWAAAVRSLRARRFVLVVDDAHLVAPDVLRTVVDLAMKELPGGSTVALASRTEPVLPLARWRANRSLVEVRVDDLAMTPAEASVLLRRAGLELGFNPVQALVRRAEGWPAALYLAALSVRDQAEVAEAVDELRGDDHRLAEYFRDEVLSGLSPKLRDFAIRTSVLDELSGALCDAVLDRQGSGRTLTELERRSALLRPLDPAHGRYRWHGLLRDALNFELCRSEPDLPQALHLRASSWYQTRGDADRAISHAVRAHDPVLAGDLLWADIVAYVSQGRNDLVQGWLARFSHEELAGHAPLAISAAYSFLAAGKLARARHCAVAAEAAMERRPDDPQRASLAAGLAGVEAMIAPAGVAGMAEAAASACETEPRDSPWRPIHLFLHGTALHLSGDRAAAEPRLAEAADLSAATAPSVMSMCLAQAAMIAIEQRDWEAAADLTDRAEAAIEQHGLAECPLSALAYAACAAVRAHHGRADEAKQDLRRGIDLLATLGDFIPWYGAEARILLAHAALWLADVVGARTLLAEASRLARRAHGAVIFQQWFDDAWSHMDGLAETSLAGASSLTIAELRVLRFLPSHRSFREIATQLGVSANTVKTQAHAVYRKLGAASRSEAVARASEAGLLGQ